MQGLYYLVKQIWMHGHMDHQPKHPIMVRLEIRGTLAICLADHPVVRLRALQQTKPLRQLVLKLQALSGSLQVGAVLLALNPHMAGSAVMVSLQWVLPLTALGP